MKYEITCNKILSTFWFFFLVTKVVSPHTTEILEKTENKKILKPKHFQPLTIDQSTGNILVF